MKTITIKVTAEDIKISASIRECEFGVYKSQQFCPLAIAIKRLSEEEASANVNESYIILRKNIGLWNTVIDLIPTKRAITFMKRWDKKHKAVPTSFRFPVVLDRR